LWPIGSWVELGAGFAERGMRSVLPWGTPAERERAEAISARVRGAVVAPPLSLTEAAALLGAARAVAGVDTGLTHLAAALGTSTVGIYCATDPAATGLYGGRRAANLGGRSAGPGVRDVLRGMESLGV
jgi:heptosyltransferase-1